MLGLSLWQRGSLFVALMVVGYRPVCAGGRAPGGIELLQIGDSISPDGTYTVRPGDTLSRLAARLLGNEERWPEIFAANRDAIQNPNLIQVGQVLRIPGSVPPPPVAEPSTEAMARWSGGKLSPREFIALLGPAAQAVARRTGVPASVTLAQAALETGWGKSTIGNAKNLFGIKGTGPAGSIRVPTREFVSGRTVTVQAAFRKYNSWEESIQDHADFLVRGRRYRRAFSAPNADQFAQAIAAAGYATDPNYAASLIKIMKAHDLYRWDQ
jgi:LysM repeat protein